MFILFFAITLCTLLPYKDKFLISAQESLQFVVHRFFQNLSERVMELVMSTLNSLNS